METLPCDAARTTIYTVLLSRLHSRAETVAQGGKEQLDRLFAVVTTGGRKVIARVLDEDAFLADPEREFFNLTWTTWQGEPLTVVPVGDNLRLDERPVTELPQAA